MEKLLKNCPRRKSNKIVKLYSSKINQSNPFTKFSLEKVGVLLGIVNIVIPETSPATNLAKTVANLVIDYLSI